MSIHFKNFAIKCLTIIFFIVQIEATKNGEDQIESENILPIVPPPSEKISESVGSTSEIVADQHHSLAAEQSDSKFMIDRTRGKQIIEYPPEDQQASAHSMLENVVEQLALYDDEPSSSSSKTAIAEGNFVAHPPEDDNKLAAAATAHSFEHHSHAFLEDMPSSSSKSMDEVYAELLTAQRLAHSDNESHGNVGRRQLTNTAEHSITEEMLDEIRTHQVVLRLYELLNAQSAIVVALMDNDRDRSQMERINEYFIKFKQFMDELPDTSAFRIPQLSNIAAQIEQPKDEVNFGEELAALEYLGESVVEMEKQFRGTEMINDGVQNVLEFQIGKYERKELICLAKTKRNVSLPLKRITDFFGTLELSNAYLTHVDNIIKQATLSRFWSFPGSFIKIDAKLALISAAISIISIIRKKVAISLQIVAEITHNAGSIGQNFTQKVLEHKPDEQLYEIAQMATIEGTSITQQKVLLLSMSCFLQRAQILLGNAHKHLKGIEDDFELISGAGTVIKSADALSKLRRHILSLDDLHKKVNDN